MNLLWFYPFLPVTFLPHSCLVYGTFRSRVFLQGYDRGIFLIFDIVLPAHGRQAEGIDKRFGGVVGYRICLTHRRSPVRARAESFWNRTLHSTVHVSIWSPIHGVRICCARHLAANLPRPLYSSPSSCYRIVYLDRSVAMHFPLRRAQWSVVGVGLEATGGQWRSSTVILDDSWFLDRIDILNRNAVEASPIQQVYRTTGDILTLVRVSALVLLSPIESRWWPN